MQTSLQSKKQQDMDYLFKKTVRSEMLKNVVKNNIEVNDVQAQATTLQKQSLLQQEKEWVNSMVEVQRNEDMWNKQKKAEITHDLRQTYFEQGNDKRDK